MQPDAKRNEALGFIRSGLQDFSISRTSLSWGIPLPWDARHVTYVWFDALTNYITAVGYGSDEERFETWWPGRHVIGKDILRFHCVYWPAMLLSAGLAPPEHVDVHGFLLVGGEKMSKTSLNQIAPSRPRGRLRRRRVPVPLPGRPRPSAPMATSPTRASSPATTPTWPTTSATSWRASPRSSTRSAVASDRAPRSDSPLAEAAATTYAEAAAAWAAFQPNEALAATWRLVRATNAYLEANEPWKAEPGAAVDAVLGDAIEALRIVAVLASPAIPEATQAIWERIGLTGAVSDQRLPEAASWGGYPGGLPVVKGASLFPRKQ